MDLQAKRLFNVSELVGFSLRLTTKAEEAVKIEAILLLGSEIA